MRRRKGESRNRERKKQERGVEEERREESNYYDFLFRPIQDSGRVDEERKGFQNLKLIADREKEKPTRNADEFD